MTSNAPNGGGIHCPQCRSTESEIKDSRPNARGVRRRRKCCNCTERFTTLESVIGSSNGMMLVTATGRCIPVSLDMESFAERTGLEVGSVVSERLRAALREALG